MKLNVKPAFDRKRSAIMVLAVLAVFAAAVCILTITGILFPTEEPAYASLILYEGPKPVPCSEVAAMKVDGHELFVYDTAVNNTHAWNDSYLPALSKAPVTSFDFEGAPVQVEIRLLDGATEISEALVRPLAAGIQAAVESNVMSFTISDPGVYTLEWNGKPTNAMYIFANAIEHDAPTESSDTLRYIGPGAWDIESLTLADDMQVYISGGAFIRGTINGDKAENVTISGHGFLDGSHNDTWMLCGRTAYVPLNLSKCKNVTVSGIAMLDPNAWCVNLYNCDNVTLEGLKVITARPNGDGITIQSSRDVLVKDCFVRSWDDSLVVKNYAGEKGTDSARITFDGCQIWTDLAQSMEIGYETNKGSKIKPTISDITFRNMTVLHNFHKPVMSIHNADDCRVFGILYENITVEDASMGKGDASGNAQFIDINTLSASWTTVKKRGTVSDVTFDGIYVLDGDDGIDFTEGNLCPIRIRGNDENAMCSDITFRNLYILGQGVDEKTARANPSSAFDKNTENICFVLDNGTQEG